MTKPVKNKSKSYFIKCNLTYFREIKNEDYPFIANWINDSKFNQFLMQGWKPVDAESIQEQFETEKKIESAIH